MNEYNIHFTSELIMQRRVRVMYAWRGRPGWGGDRIGINTGSGWVDFESPLAA